MQTCPKCGDVHETEILHRSDGAIRTTFNCTCGLWTLSLCFAGVPKQCQSFIATIVSCVLTMARFSSLAISNIATIVSPRKPSWCVESSYTLANQSTSYNSTCSRLPIKANIFKPLRRGFLLVSTKWCKQNYKICLYWRKDVNNKDQQLSQPFESIL